MKLARREWMRWAGISGLAALLPSGCASADADATEDCPLTPAQTEGPFFVRDRLERADLRFRASDGSRIAGVELALELEVVVRDGQGCSARPGWIVDIWHCDAAGNYSAVDNGLGGRSSAGGDPFLRGFQRTDASGRVRFRTIYPGWYPGRAVHVHFKVSQPQVPQSRRSFTSQLYFADTVSQRVHREPSYRGRGAPPQNASDGIFRYGGEQLLLRPEPGTEGYSARFRVALRDS